MTLALACLLLQSGERRHPILAEAREIVRSGRGLEDWEGAVEKDRQERLEMYRKLGNRFVAMES